MWSINQAICRRCFCFSVIVRKLSSILGAPLATMLALLALRPRRPRHRRGRRASAKPSRRRPLNLAPSSTHMRRSKCQPCRCPMPRTLCLPTWLPRGPCTWDMTRGNRHSHNLRPSLRPSSIPRKRHRPTFPPYLRQERWASTPLSSLCMSLASPASICRRPMWRCMASLRSQRRPRFTFNRCPSTTCNRRRIRHRCPRRLIPFSSTAAAYVATQSPRRVLRRRRRFPTPKTKRAL